MLTYVTPSMLTSYLTCPQQFYFSYILKLPQTTNAPAWLGLKVHEAIQATLEAKLLRSSKIGAVDMDLSYCHKAFGERFTKLVNYKGAPVRIDWKEGDNPEALEEKGRQLIDLYINSDEFQNMDVREIEQVIELHLIPVEDLANPQESTFRIAEPQEKKFMTVYCRLDGILANHQIIDYKTSNKAYIVADVERKIQFDMYALALFADRFTNLAQVINLRVDVLIKKIKDNSLQVIEFHKTKQDRERVSKQLFQICKGIEQGIYYPTPNIFCNGYCQFQKQCKGEKNGTSN